MNYFVHLLLEKSTFCMKSIQLLLLFISLTFTAAAQYAPTADFDYDEEDPGEFEFTDESSGDPDEWDWDFGDGNDSSDQDPDHTYEEPGEYEVCLTVENEYGDDTHCEDIEVILPPEADFDVDRLSDNAFRFEDESTNEPTDWEWDFGDGNTSDDQDPTHSYESTGLFEVCLEASNDAGSDEYCDNVEAVVVNATEADLADSPRVLLYPSPAVDIVDIDFRAAQSQPAQLIIHNSVGQQMYGKAFAQAPDHYRVTVADWPAGQYYLSVVLDRRDLVHIPFQIIQ